MSDKVACLNFGVIPLKVKYYFKKIKKNQHIVPLNVTKSAYRVLLYPTNCLSLYRDYGWGFDTVLKVVMLFGAYSSFYFGAMLILVGKEKKVIFAL